MADQDPKILNLTIQLQGADQITKFSSMLADCCKAYGLKHVAICADLQKQVLDQVNEIQSKNGSGDLNQGESGKSSS